MTREEAKPGTAKGDDQADLANPLGSVGMIQPPSINALSALLTDETRDGSKDTAQIVYLKDRRPAEL